MCDFEFLLPENKESLLESSSNAYYVKDVCVISLIRDHLKQARDAFNYDGPEAVLNHFNVYYSVIHYGTKLEVELISKSLKDLVKPFQNLSTYLENILQDNEVPQEIQQKTLNILKMLVYLFTQITMLLENKIEIKLQRDLTVAKKGTKGKAKSKRNDEENFEADFKLKQLSLLYKIMQLPICKLWDPPVTEELFTRSIADVCFAFLINPSIKYDKEMCNMIFYIFGTLIKNYNYSWTFTVRLTQAIKDKEHLQSVVPSGIQILVTEFNCLGLVRELVRELTEWQSEEAFQDVPGARHCSAILTEMTAIMPNLMLPELVYLLKYLNSTSYTLRNCILSIITEVVITVLTNENITEEQIVIRNKLLSKLLVYICDTNAHVRSKVLQHWIRLHTEAAIPKDMQMDVLRKASRRLEDKATLVRKYALQLMSVFLKCNIYTAILDIEVFQKDLETEVEKYNEIVKMPDDMMEQIKNSEVEWDHIKDELLKVVTECLEDEEKENDMEVEINDKSKDEIKSYILAGKYKAAFFICREFISESETNMEEIEEMPIDKRANFYVTFMQSIYTNMNKVAENLVNLNIQRLAQLSAEEMENLKKCDENIQYLKDVISFLNYIENEVFPLVIDMLKSSVMTDVSEAIEFFVTAHQFKMKQASKGLATMLEQMNTTEQERKKLVIDAYRHVFLTYDGPPKDKPEAIVKTLIELLQNVNAADLQYLSTVVTQWAEKGDLDHAVIQQFWHMFIGQVVDAADDDRLSALQFLAMIAHGKRTVIERNLNLVSEIVFSDKCLEDPRYLLIGCNMISNMEEEINVESKNPCFRVPLDDVMWEHLVEKVIKIYQRKDPFCHAIIVASVSLIYKICQKPDVLATKLIRNTVALIKEPNSNIVVSDKIDSTHLALFCHLVGEIAIRQFSFLDITVYKELKRRNNIKDERKRTQKDSKKNDSANVSKASASCRTPLINSQDEEESYLEGAQADDLDAEYILNVCERGLVSGNLLGQYAPMFAFIIRNYQKFDNEELQSSAALALIRFMIVSSQLCTKYLHVIMTTLETTKYSSVKTNIFIALADLLHRFPNLIEPESKHMFKVVKDTDETVRMTAISTLSKLIMEDMLRVKETIADLALCIVDESPVIVKMTEEFFHLLAQKGNAIYNVLPDVFAKLSHDKNQIDQDIFKKVMMFLIQLISKDKQIESLVEKLCLRFNLSDKRRVWRDLAYCLTLLNYNEKSLLRLKDNFANYKNCLEDDTVYDHLLSIVNRHRNSTKDEMKAIVRALDQLIRTGEVTADNNVLNETRTKKQSTRGRKKKARVQFNDDEDD